MRTCPPKLRSGANKISPQSSSFKVENSLQMTRDNDQFDAWYQNQVQTGLASANAGRLVAANQVEADFAMRREITRRKLRSADTGHSGDLGYGHK